MFATIRIECIGAVPDARHASLDRMLGGFLGYNECFKNRWWVAEITGTCDKYGFVRKFKSPIRDASHSNSKGSRGIYANYQLEYGKVYDVSSPVSWKNTDRYYVLAGKEMERMNKEEVFEWLRKRSE